MSTVGEENTTYGDRILKEIESHRTTKIVRGSCLGSFMMSQHDSHFEVERDCLFICLFGAG